MRLPAKDSSARQILDIISRQTSIDGSTLMKHMRVSDPAELVKPLRELQNLGLIEVGGELNPEGLLFARVAVPPSMRERVNYMLKQDMA